MAYEKQTFVDRVVDENGNITTEGTKLKSEHLKHMEDGIAAANADLNTFIRNSDIDHAYDEASGAYYTVIRIYKQKLDGTEQHPFVYALMYNGKYGTTAYDLAHGTNLLLVANAGIFDTTTLEPEGMIIQNGTVLNNTPSGRLSKPLTIDKNGDLGYAAYDADAAELAADGIVSAVCGFMPIIVDYEAVPSSEWNSVSHYTENAQRQIIGQWGNGDYAIVTCEGRDFHGSDGWTIAEAQAVCQRLGLKFAYNLDGGGSTETMLGLKHINTIYEGSTGRTVPTFIVFNGSDSFNTETSWKPYKSEIECVISDGNQYIDTGFKPDNNTRVVITAKQNSEIDVNWLYGVRKSATEELFNGQFNYYTGVKTAYGAASKTAAIASEGKKVTFDQNKNAVTVTAEGGATASIAHTAATFECTYNLFVGSICLAGNSANERTSFHGAIYSCQIYDNGVLVRDFIPVLDHSGVPCFYDKITNCLYHSSGAKAFAAPEEGNA